MREKWTELKNTVKENINGLMEMNTKVIGLMMLQRDMEQLITKVEIYMKEHGR